MQNNYYFLKKLSGKLKEFLPGFRLGECYSQNKDELVLAFYNSQTEEEFFIRALLRPDFCCLSFPQKLHRARRNSVDIFPELSDNTVSGIRQYKNERAFLLEFTNDFGLLFKMHGNRSNIILCKDEKPLELFNSRLQKDIEIKPESLDRPLDQNYQQFVREDGDYRKLFPTFGKTIRKYLELKNYDELSLAGKWDLLEAVQKELEQPWYFIINNEMPEFSLLKYGEVESEYNDPLTAVSDFNVRWLSRHKFLTAKRAALKTLGKEMKKDKSYVTNTRQKLRQVESENNYRQWADVLMANMHRVKTGEKEVILENFYNGNKPAQIPLNPELNAQSNAARYYQKAKNQHKEVGILREGLQKREQILAQKEQQYKTLEAATDPEEIGRLLPNAAKGKKVKEKKEVNLPYHYFSIDGYDVLVGKSARHNDILLQQFSKKDDLWLHARDTSGSHVIIRQKNKDKIPDPVIEKAAGLAAYNSKRKTDSLCPVIFTQRKYVRKRKGDPPGAVVVDREEVIMVEPSMSV